MSQEVKSIVFKGVNYTYRNTVQGCQITIHFEDIGNYTFYIDIESNVSTYAKKVIMEHHRQLKKVKDVNKLKNIIREFIEKLTEDINQNIESQTLDNAVKAITMNNITPGSLFIPKDTDILTPEDTIIVLSADNKKASILKLYTDFDSGNKVEKILYEFTGCIISELDVNTLTENYMFIDDSLKKFTDSITDSLQHIKTMVENISESVESVTNNINQDDSNKDYFSLALQAITDSKEYNGYEKDKMIKAIIEKNES